MVYDFLINLGYLVGAIAFVWGLRLLSSPDTARRGNILAGIGMGLAILSALFTREIAAPSNNYAWILGGMVVGGTIGGFAAKKVKMTDMPQMVSIFNGLGGACAVLLASVELFLMYKGTSAPASNGQLGIILGTVLIGGITFTGSMLAYAKLQGLIWDNTFVLPKHNLINNILLVGLIAFAVYLFILGSTAGTTLGIIFLALALIYGASFVIPIGGADMPVVISLLNSFSGLSAAAAGLIYGNNMMLVGGILVGASGTILTVLMCEAMNRSLLNVLIGGFGGGGASAKGADGEQIAKEVSLSDAAIQLFYSQSVVVIPGYGLAVAQAQKVVKEVDDLLSANGVEVKYGIHPVAGRMPGHMNVLLAEADVPYDKLLDLDDTNSALKNADFAIIVGANDVVNPAALDDPGSPIYGMPVLEVWNAKHVIVLKRSMNPGYAGIQNPLFFHDKNRMLFGDAKDTMTNLASELKGM